MADHDLLEQLVGITAEIILRAARTYLDDRKLAVHQDTLLKYIEASIVTHKEFLEQAINSARQAYAAGLDDLAPELYALTIESIGIAAAHAASAGGADDASSKR